MNGSYHINHFSTNIESEVKRLQGQVDLFFEKEFKVYQEIGLKDGMNMIECGCGPGYLLFRILEKLPGCQATGLEIDPLLFKLLQENIQKLDCPVRPIQASITETGLNDSQFDLIISRLVFEHLSDPVSALKEMYRILKPGGKLIIVSNDFKMHLITYPAVEELDAMYDAYCQSRIDEGGNPYIGRELPGLLKQNLFSNISFNIVGAHSQIDGDRAFLKSEDVNISRNLVQKGYLSEKTLQTLAEKWYNMLNSGNHCITRQLYVTGCEKMGQSGHVEIISDKQDHSSADISQLLEKIKSGEKTSEAKNIKTYLKTILSKAMEIPADEIMEDIPLFDLGIDSLSAVEVNNALKHDFEMNLGIADMLDKYAMMDIMEHLQAHLHQQQFDHPENNQTPSDWEEGEV